MDAAPTVYLPPKARAWCYLVYAVLTAACSGTAAGMLAADLSVPPWLKITSAVVASLGTPLGLLAAAHTTRTRTAKAHRGAAPDASGEKEKESEKTRDETERAVINAQINAHDLARAA